jgi:hypothetical protein
MNAMREDQASGLTRSPLADGSPRNQGDLPGEAA